MKRLVLYISFFLAVTSASFSQNVTVSAAFDSARIYIGDQIKYTVTVEQPANLNLTLPVFKDSLVKNIEILSGPLFDTVRSADGGLKITERYLITSFDSGYYQVPPVYAELKNEEGIKRFYSDYSQLEVMRVKIAPSDSTAKIYDIISPYRAPVTIGEIIPWVLAAALLTAFIWYGLRLVKKFRMKETGVEEVIIREPAHIIAFRELERLRDDQVWQKGEIKLYYTRLTEILRQYLENRYNVFSLELTTAETLDALVKTGFKKDAHYNQLRTILSGADLVKFAKYNPEPAENDIHFQNSWDFVQVTKEEFSAGGEKADTLKTEEGKV
ncbi:MAG: hypothetical protein IPH69_06885 [Bacteroidales bacterium]|nr:hypothetical protein [Bacteroidales bacterium]